MLKLCAENIFARANIELVAESPRGRKFQRFRAINYFLAAQIKFGSADQNIFFRQRFACAQPRPQKTKIRVEKFRTNYLLAIRENEQVLIIAEIYDKCSTAVYFGFKNFRRV